MKSYSVFVLLISILVTTVCLSCTKSKKAHLRRQKYILLQKKISEELVQKYKEIIPHLMSYDKANILFQLATEYRVIADCYRDLLYCVEDIRKKCPSLSSKKIFQYRHYQIKFLDKAMAVYTRILKRHKRHLRISRIWFRLAQTLSLLKRYQEAYSYYKKVLNYGLQNIKKWKYVRRHYIYNLIELAYHSIRVNDDRKKYKYYFQLAKRSIKTENSYGKLLHYEVSFYQCRSLLLLKKIKSSLSCLDSLLDRKQKGINKQKFTKWRMRTKRLKIAIKLNFKEVR